MVSGDKRTRDLMEQSENELWAAFRRANQFGHMGDRGDVREERLTRFLREQLPGRYSVVSGEVIDAAGSQSGQTDILVYDNSNTRPLVTSGDVAILPAEAVLASIEVKTTLNSNENQKIVRGMKKMRSLRPWDAPWTVARLGGKAADDRMPRLFSTVFAYATDLTEQNWATKELSRFRNSAQAEGLPVQYIDRLVVLDRGILLPANGSCYQPATEQGVLGLWFFHLVTFLAREVARRDPFPWERYKWHDKASWQNVAEPIYDAPEAERATSAERLKAKKRRRASNKSA